MKKRNFVTALVFAATAAIAPVQAASAAPADGGLVNVVVKDVLNGNEVTILNNVAVVVAAAVCQVDVNVLTSQLDQHGKGDCPAKTNVDQLAYVINA